jgi:hypothetical protein
MAERRPHVILTPVSDRDLAAFRRYCERKQRTTEHVAGELLHAWIEEQAGSRAPPGRSLVRSSIDEVKESAQESTCR